MAARNSGFGGCSSTGRSSSRATDSAAVRGFVQQRGCVAENDSGSEKGSGVGLSFD